jgi:hypothetical protein
MGDCKCVSSELTLTLTLILRPCDHSCWLVISIQYEAFPVMILLILICGYLNIVNGDWEMSCNRYS